MVLPIFTTLCVVIKIVFQVGFLFWRVCVEEQRTGCESKGLAECEKIFDKREIQWINPESVCETSFEFMAWYTDPSTFWFTTCFVSLPIIWAFFLLNTPHDCFRCLGKDPDRIFSIYQYNRIDRQNLIVW